MYIAFIIVAPVMFDEFSTLVEAEYSRVAIIHQEIYMNDC